MLDDKSIRIRNPFLVLMDPDPESPKTYGSGSETLPTGYLFQISVSAKQADIPEVGRVSQLEDETLLLPLFCVTGRETYFTNIWEFCIHVEA